MIATNLDREADKKRKQAEIDTIRKTTPQRALHSATPHIHDSGLLPETTIAMLLMPYMGIVPRSFRHPIQFSLGLSFTRSAFSALRIRTFNMDSLGSYRHDDRVYLQFH